MIRHLKDTPFLISCIKSGTKGRSGRVSCLVDVAMARRWLISARPPERVEHRCEQCKHKCSHWQVAGMARRSRHVTPNQQSRPSGITWQAHQESMRCAAYGCGASEHIEHHGAQCEHKRSHWQIVEKADAPDVFPGQLLDNKHPRRHTAMTPTRNAERTTQAQWFTWLALRRVDEWAWRITVVRWYGNEWRRLGFVRIVEDQGYSWQRWRSGSHPMKTWAR